MLDIAFDKRFDFRIFAMISTATFVLIFATAIQNLHPFIAFAMSAIGGSMPYLMLRMKFSSVRKKAGMEGEIFVANFLSAYRICNYNVYHAIEYIAEENSEAKKSRALIMRILLELRTVGERESMKAVLNKFAYAINTNWSRMLAHNLFVAAETGKNISLAIEDILLQLREAGALMEERKRLNSEANRMVLFLIPFLYVSTVLLAVYYMDIPFLRFIKNQLFTTEGFLLFTVSFFMFVANLLMLEFINSRSLDY